MNKLLFLFPLIILVSCGTKIRKADPHPDVFAADQLRGCFLLFNVKTQTLEKKIGTICDERFTASSTFKVPLAVMAFDSGALKDEKEVLKWDGRKRMLDVWNKDQNAETWMKASVVWFSQRLTPKIGMEKLQKYLDSFNYGNKNIQAGLIDAWLLPTNKPEAALSISPVEQLEFMKKLWSKTLPASARSQELTQKIMYLEELSSGYSMSGKTGSNFFDEKKFYQLGWFVGRFEKAGQEYLTVTAIADLVPYREKQFGGMRAKEFTKILFAENVQK